jgi:hypothetical protein
MTTGVSAAPIDNVNNAPEKEIGIEMVREGTERKAQEEEYE